MVTGGSGFIGRKLCAGLISLEAQVFNLDMNQPRSGENSGAEYLPVDLTEKEQIIDAINQIKPEIVFHLAADISRAGDFQVLYRIVDTNLMATMNLLSGLAQTDSLQSVIIAGTAEEYGINEAPFREAIRENPVSPYSYSKVCQSHLCTLAYKLYGVPVTVLRASLAYGPGQGEVMFIPSLIKALLRDEPFPMTTGEQLRDFIYIDDLVEAYVTAGSSGVVAGEILNIGLGKSYKIKDIAMKIGRLLGKEHLILTGKMGYRNLEVMDYRVDISKARKVLSWAPKVDIDRGLQLTVEGFLKS
jgi:UDP-glucose 4-epimerase